MRRIAVTADEAMLEILADAGLTLWHDGLDLTSGDSLFIGDDLATPELIARTGRIAIPGVPVFLVTANPHNPNLWDQAQALGARSIMVLPEGLPFLRSYACLIEALAVGSGPEVPRTVRLSLTVTTEAAGLYFAHGRPGEGREKRDRLRAAVINSGFVWPDLQMTARWNDLAALRVKWDDLATVHRSGAELDLAMAAGILAAGGVVPVDSLVGRVFIGELGLDGRVRPVADAALLVRAARGEGRSRFVIPAGTELPAQTRLGADVEPIADLQELVALLRTS